MNPRQWAFATSLVLAACHGSESGGPERGVGSAPAPEYHRANADQCLTVAPPGNCTATGVMPEAGFNCTQDSDCTAGVNGRCATLSIGASAGCSCTYDACMRDTDCPSGQTCACHGPPYTEFGNTCVDGNCRVDTDCGGGGYCSPSAPTELCGGREGVAGYYCHTLNDTCVDDSDCRDEAGAPSGAFCEYSTMDRRWECKMAMVCF